jgi:hypothetical protein
MKGLLIGTSPNALPKERYGKQARAITATFC